MQTVTHTHSFDLPQPIDQLFPLFSPEGEKLWVPDWDYVGIVDAHPLAEDGVFLTQNHDHSDNAGLDAVWLVKKYDAANHVVQFYKIEPSLKVGLITVACVALSSSETRTNVTYRYTALSETGAEFIRGFDALAYEAFIGEWRELLMKYFEEK
ncbi:MAG: hypothetical protein H6R05_448 [Burkholderiaceae bacterium]|nr:hypothetical protein [Burkholderiaceae bacterium]